MPLLVTALLGLLFLPGSAMAPVAEASSAAPVAIASGDDPSPAKVAQPAPQEATSTDYTVKLTAYNAVPSQTDDDPSVTASGAASNSDVIAARSNDLAHKLPFGTVIAITRDGNDTPNCAFNKVNHLIGYRVIADSMAMRWTKRVDVQLNENDTVPVNGVPTNPAIALGLCSGVSVHVVGHIPLSKIPDTQEELAKMFESTTLALNS